MDEGITLQTFGDLLKHVYKLSGRCHRCSVHKDVDLTVLAPIRVYVGARFECRACGGRVEITLRQIVTGSDDNLTALVKWRDR